MTTTTFEQYAKINDIQHRNIIKNLYPNANEFKKSDIKNIIFHAMQLKQILERTQAFEVAINESNDLIFNPFKRYPDLTNHTKKLINDINFLETWLKNKGIDYTPLALSSSIEYATHIRASTPEQVLAHFFANTHAVIIAHKESIENIIPESKLEKKGLSHYHFEGIKAKEFEALLNEVLFNNEQEQSFLQEVTVSFKKLFDVLQEQDNWCKEHQHHFLNSDSLVRTWAPTQIPAKPSSYSSCMKWGIIAVAATTIAATAVYSTLSPNL